jgi:hypothetical protein
MSVNTFEALSLHIGHRIVCVGDGGDAPANVAVECETFHVGLIDFDREDADADEPNE